MAIARKIVIKLGGSILTRKDTETFPLDIDEIRHRADEFIRHDAIGRLAKEIKEAIDEGDIRIVLVNGVGPFGHYLVANDAPGDVVRASTKELNDRLIAELRKAGIDAVPISTGENCSFEEGRGFDIGCLWDRAESLLEGGKIPSVWGDELKSGKIISGDDLVGLIAEKWNADKIIAATDTDGVYDKNPEEHEDAKLIKKIDADGHHGVNFSLDRVDITGGMQKKVEKLIKAAQQGIKAQIINGFVEGNVKAALLGDDSTGTLIAP